MVCDVLIIYPPIELGKKVKFGFPPLGALYLASFLEVKGINVKIVDCEIKGYSLKQIVNLVKKEKPFLFCMSIMTPQVISCLKIAAAIKKNCNTNIVVGGSHISSTIGELFQFTNSIDFLVYREGEYTIFELYVALKNKSNLNKVYGLIYRKNKKIIINRPRELISNLDDLPFPNLKLVDIKDYDSYYAKSLPLTSMMCSRGCPYNCSFCDQYATHGRKLRLRSVKNVVDEIEKNYYESEIKQIVFKDSTFTINKKWVRELCGEIKKRRLKINWTCNTRADHIDEKTLEEMKAAGCYMVLLGIESGSQEVLNNINKNIKLKQIEDAVKLCKKHKMKVTGSFMVGNPGDTKQTVLESIKFSKSLDLDLVTFGVTIAYPNTELFKWAVKNNVLTDKTWYMKEGSNIAMGLRNILGNLNLKRFPISEQTKMVKKANREFYLRPKYIFKKTLEISNLTEFKRTLRSAKELLLS